HRYNAACSAALASCGQGRDPDRLTDQQRAALRRQALTWLRADLAAWTSLVDQGAPEARQLAQQKLRHWQKDTDLASLRDPAALARRPRCPAGDQEACRKCWPVVAALLARTHAPDARGPVSRPPAR